MLFNIHRKLCKTNEERSIWKFWNKQWMSCWIIGYQISIPVRDLYLSYECESSWVLTLHITVLWPPCVLCQYGEVTAHIQTKQATTFNTPRRHFCLNSVGVWGVWWSRYFWDWLKCFKWEKIIEMESVRNISGALTAIHSADESGKTVRTSWSILRCFLFFDICYLMSSVTLIGN